MGQFLIFMIPAAAFLLVAGLAIAIVSYGAKRFGGESKALSKRLDEASELRFSESQDVLAKYQEPQATGLLARLVERTPGYDRLKLLLIRSGSAKTANETLLICLSAGVGAFLLSWAVPPLGPIIGLVLGTITFGVPIFFLVARESKRLAKFETQLPEALDFLSRALRAGHGLTAALAMVGDELEEPVGKEFKTTFDEINFGLAFNQAMSNLALRINSPDLNFFVVALAHPA